MTSIFVPPRSTPSRMSQPLPYERVDLAPMFGPKMRLFADGQERLQALVRDHVYPENLGGCFGGRGEVLGNIVDEESGTARPRRQRFHGRAFGARVDVKGVAETPGLEIAQARRRLRRRDVREHDDVQAIAQA